MFSTITRTWNPVVGCLHKCSFCYARNLAETKLKHLPRYQNGFTPKLVESELRRRFHQGFIFVSDMGDLWGKWVPKEWIEKVLEVVRESPKATFLFLTKNPRRYHDFLEVMPLNVVLGATIESDLILTSEYTRAPSPRDRGQAMFDIFERPKMVSIEPIMDFDPLGLAGWIKAIGPQFTYVGYDNHGHHLPEPPLEKTQALIMVLGQFTEVRLKTIRKAWNE